MLATNGILHRHILHSIKGTLPCNSRLVSTRRTPPVVASQEIPRFLRRQLIRKSNSGEGASSTQSPAEPSPKQFRSKHFDPATSTIPQSEKRHLQPHVLSARIKKLCDNGKLDDAIFMLKNVPLDAQNTQVWNTMIWETLKGKRHSLAYQLYIDMKRRGFVPSVRTFQTIFGGLSRLENWSTLTKQLKHVKSLYEGYQKLVNSLKEHDPNDPDLSPKPIADYIRILGKAGEYQTIFDVYYSMDKEGVLAPDRLVYTAMFQAIHAAMSDTVEGRFKVAADARLLWSQMIKSSKKNIDASPDSYTISAAITALSGGSTMDHKLAFNIIAEYYGLAIDEATCQPGKFPLPAESLISILRLCNISKNYDLCTQIYQQVRRRPENLGGTGILDRGHMEEVLKADISLREDGLGYHAVQTLEWMIRRELSGSNGPKIRPAHSTYLLVMQACWHCTDWNSAKRTFDLMTGYHSHDFMDGAIAGTPRLDKRTSYPPSADFMSLMLRTAIATENKANLRQILRIISHIGYDTILATRGDVVQESTKVHKTRSFIHEKFNSAVVDATNELLDHNGNYVQSDEREKFETLAKKAKAF